MAQNLEIDVTTARWIEWCGELLSTLLLFGFLYVIMRMVDGPNHHPVITLPLVGRLVIFVVLAVAVTTTRVWLTNRRRRRR